MKQEAKNAIWSMVRLSMTAMLGVVIGHVSNGHDIWSIQWKEIAGAGLVAAAVWGYNWLNPNNKNFGVNAKSDT